MTMMIHAELNVGKAQILAPGNSGFIFAVSRVWINAHGKGMIDKPVDPAGLLRESVS